MPAGPDSATTCAPSLRAVARSACRKRLQGSPDSWYRAFVDEHLGFVSVQQRNGTVTIPAQARRALGLDQPGAQVEVVLRDGVLVLVPYTAVPTETAWFWSEGHQGAEREADTDLAAGRHTDFDDAEQLLNHLENLHQQAEE